MRKKMQKNIQENHKLTEPLRLEKAFKINKSKYKADIAKATSNPRPQVPHLQNFASPAVPWVGEELPNPLRQAQGGTGLVCAGVGDKRQHLGHWGVSQVSYGWTSMVLQGPFQPQPSQGSLWEKVDINTCRIMGQQLCPSAMMCLWENQKGW